MKITTMNILRRRQIFDELYFLFRLHLKFQRWIGRMSSSWHQEKWPSQTHTYTHSSSLSLSLTHTHTHTRCFSLSISLFVSFSIQPSRFLSFSLFLPLYLSLPPYLSRPFPFFLSLSLLFMLSDVVTNTQSLVLTFLQLFTFSELRCCRRKFETWLGLKVTFPYKVSLFGLALKVCQWWRWEQKCLHWLRTNWFQIT